MPHGLAGWRTVGLYLSPPDKAIVVCVDEKPQAQALERTAPVLPVRPDVTEKRAHDYIRHGTTTLFAALEIATGKVTDACYPAAASRGLSNADASLGWVWPTPMASAWVWRSVRGGLICRLVGVMTAK
jgi:hypothetical protein